MKKKIRQKLAREKRKIEKRLGEAVKVNDGAPVLRAKNIDFELTDKAGAISYGGIGVIQGVVHKIKLPQHITPNCPAISTIVYRRPPDRRLARAKRRSARGMR